MHWYLDISICWSFVYHMSTHGPNCQIAHAVLYDFITWPGTALCFIGFFTVALLARSVCRKPRITHMTVRFSVGIGQLPLELTWLFSSMDGTWYTATPAILLIRSHISLAILCLRCYYRAAFQFLSFLHIFSYGEPREFIAFLCSINDRRFLSVYWTEIGNFNDNESSADWCGVVSWKLTL
jgi:hypothetical protein